MELQGTLPVPYGNGTLLIMNFVRIHSLFKIFLNSQRSNMLIDKLMTDIESHEVILCLFYLNFKNGYNLQYISKIRILIYVP